MIISSYLSMHARITSGKEDTDKESTVATIDACFSAYNINWILYSCCTMCWWHAAIMHDSQETQDSSSWSHNNLGRSLPCACHGADADTVADAVPWQPLIKHKAKLMCCHHCT